MLQAFNFQHSSCWSKKYADLRVIIPANWLTTTCCVDLILVIFSGSGTDRWQIWFCCSSNCEKTSKWAKQQISLNCWNNWICLGGESELPGKAAWFVRSLDHLIERIHLSKRRFCVCSQTHSHRTNQHPLKNDWQVRVWFKCDDQRARQFVWNWRVYFIERAKNNLFCSFLFNGKGVFCSVDWLHTRVGGYVSGFFIPHQHRLLVVHLS